MSATAAASESSLPLERPIGQPELAAAPASRRSMAVLVLILVLAQLGWLGALGYGLVLFARGA